MKLKECFGKIFNVVLGHELFRLVVLVMVTLRTCAFLNPIIGPFVKFTIVWAVLILIKDLFTERLFLTNRYRLILYLFLISYGVTILLKREENFAHNVAMLGYLGVNLLVVYAYEPKKLAGQVKRELLRFCHVFMVTAFIGQFITLAAFVLNVNFAYTIGDTVNYFGIYEGRMWGFYTNPNAGSFYAVICLMMTMLCMLIQKGNVPRRWKVFYWLNMAVEALVFFLGNSRTSLLTACAFMVLFPALLAIPDIVKCWKNRKERSLKIRKAVIVCVIAPLALLGTHEYAIKVLPYFILPTNFVADRLTKGLETSPDIVTMESSEDLERQEGSKFGGRYCLWRAGVEIVKNDPLFGVADENVPDYAYKYAARYYTDFGVDVYLPGVTGGLHNLFFQIASASGLVGLGIFLLFGVLALVRAVRYYIWMVRKDCLNSVAVALLTIVLIILLRTMTDTGILYGLYYLGIVFWTAMSALMYFIDAEYPAGNKPLGLLIDNLLFHRKKDGGMPRIKPLPKSRKIFRKTARKVLD